MNLFSLQYRQQESSRFYLTITLLLAGGLMVLGFMPSLSMQQSITFCLFKNVTGIPCPACGTGRGIVHLFHGHWWEAVLMNPVSVPVFILIVLMPLWLLHDFIRNRPTLFSSYKTFNTFFRKHPGIYLLLILMVLANWIWNLTKF